MQEYLISDHQSRYGSSTQYGYQVHSHIHFVLFYGLSHIFMADIKELKWGG